MHIFKGSSKLQTPDYTDLFGHACPLAECITRNSLSGTADSSTISCSSSHPGDCLQFAGARKAPGSPLVPTLALRASLRERTPDSPSRAAAGGPTAGVGVSTPTSERSASPAIVVPKLWEQGNTPRPAAELSAARCAAAAASCSSAHPGRSFLRARTSNIFCPELCEIALIVAQNGRGPCGRAGC
jgi:hypothetical protein